MHQGSLLWPVMWLGTVVFEIVFWGERFSTVLSVTGRLISPLPPWFMSQHQITMQDSLTHYSVVHMKHEPLGPHSVSCFIYDSEWRSLKRKSNLSIFFTHGKISIYLIWINSVSFSLLSLVLTYQMLQRPVQSEYCLSFICSYLPMIKCSST